MEARSNPYRSDVSDEPADQKPARRRLAVSALHDDAVHGGFSADNPGLAAGCMVFARAISTATSDGFRADVMAGLPACSRRLLSGGVSRRVRRREKTVGRTV